MVNIENCKKAYFIRIIILYKHADICGGCARRGKVVAVSKAATVGFFCMVCSEFAAVSAANGQ